MVSALASRGDGTLIVAARSGLANFDPATGSFVPVAPYPHADERCRSNDGRCDPHGRFWIGTMMNNFDEGGGAQDVTEAIGVLYRVDPGLEISQVIDGIGIPNAICFSPDGRTMYFADTLAETIWAFEVDIATGNLRNRRVFVGPGVVGYPDGACVDAEGYVWNARWEGNCVIRFAPNGSIDRIVDVPASRVTCCAFGSLNLDALYITTSRAGLTEAALANEPDAGGLFVCSPGVMGIAGATFAG